MSNVNYEIVKYHLNLSES